MELMEQSGDKLQTFFELWGCKESYIKAIGVGLNLELNKLDFMNENNQIRMNFEAVICCGYKEDEEKLGSQITDFIKSTKLLGGQSNKEPLHVFHSVSFQDIQENKWLSRN
ncbi:unnamed protein product [Mucor hiemalis]